MYIWHSLGYKIYKDNLKLVKNDILKSYNVILRQKKIFRELHAVHLTSMNMHFSLPYIKNNSIFKCIFNVHYTTTLYHVIFTVQKSAMNNQ